MLVYKRIMAGCDKFTIQGIRPFQEGPPFNMGITHYAGIRCSPREIFFYEIIDDSSPEFIPDIQHKMWKTMLNSRHTGIVEAVQVTASGLFLRCSGAGIVP